MDKPRVNYIDLAPPLVIGQSVRLLLPRRWVITTPVIEATYTTRGPIIETKNTFYWPGETDESIPVPSIPRRAPMKIAVGLPPRYRNLNNPF